MKPLLCILLAVCLLTTPCLAITPLSDDAITIDAPSACLLEKTTGTIIYEKDAHTRRPIASVTKVMTLLLIMEAIENGSITWETNVVATAHAASMGGSQIWLEEGETMTVSEMVKCITVVSANDCSVAMAEHLCGTEEAFADAMNSKAAELGLENTHFINCTGLFDDENHYSSAYDVAIMARELISHEAIKTYSTIWMDTARNGEFGLNNTNKLIYYYEGATGLKTGYTDKAKYCLAATAERSGVEYVAAVLGADSSDHRFASAKVLLNYAFANFTLTDLASGVALPPVAVRMGTAESVQPVYPEGSTMLMEKAGAQALTYTPELTETLEAPVCAGDSIGSVKIYSGENMIAELPVVAASDVPRLTIPDIFLLMVHVLLCEAP
ncbi:MAG: D-alanyl-D-alanine carboxypeptidase [Oscillospiraceae bacterium]|nr:D-alanyl-D-alanine carboxypeptidase [Oscillospiraceae bacterium]